MRILKRFTLNELAMTAETPKSETQQYVLMLKNAGYLVRMKSRVPNDPNTPYMFVSGKYTGPKAPMVQRVKRVFDQNLNKVVWPDQEGGEA